LLISDYKRSRQNQLAMYFEDELNDLDDDHISGA